MSSISKEDLFLFMVLLGASPKERHVEQHDVFFGIANSLTDLIPDVQEFWPAPQLHIDGWRMVTSVNNYEVSVVKHRLQVESQSRQLFFLNLGGYKPEELEEYHYKTIVAASGIGEAVQIAKKTAFFKHTGFKGAPAHVDDKFGIDVDDIFKVTEMLPQRVKDRYSIQLMPSTSVHKDEIHLGYFKLNGL